MECEGFIGKVIGGEAEQEGSRREAAAEPRDLYIGRPLSHGDSATAAGVQQASNASGHLARQAGSEPER